MDKTKLLMDLQVYDSLIKETQTALLEIQNAIDDNSLEVEASNIHDAISEKLGSIASTRAKLERDITRLIQQRDGVNDRIYSGNIQNEKGLFALQEEMASLEDKIEGTENSLLEAMLEHEKYEAGFARAEKNLTRARSSRRAGLAMLVKQKDDNVSLLSEKIPLRDEARDKCDPISLHSYDRLRRSKDGLAIATMQSDLCSACRVTIPSQMIQQLRKGSELVFCNSCQRILCLMD